MQEMQVYASELAKFSWLDDTHEILVAGKGIVGVAIQAIEHTNPADLVGGATDGEEVAAGTTKVKPGSQWRFRAERPLVESGNGGSFAFLIPQL